MYTPITASVLLATLASGAAITRRDDAGPTVWKSPDGGNTQVRFGDNLVYVGACDPQSIIDTVGSNCYEEGFCNASEWTMQCEEGDAATHTITIKAPEGQYQTWIRNGLVDAMKAAIATDGVTKKEGITAMRGGGCVGCTWYPSDITIYHMPSTIGISHNNDGTVPDVITLEITNNDDDADGGLCEVLTGIGGAIAGSVNGAAGGIFSLGSLACKAI